MAKLLSMNPRRGRFDSMGGDHGEVCAHVDKTFQLVRDQVPWAGTTNRAQGVR